MLVYIVITKVLNSWKRAGRLGSLALVITKLTAITDLLSYFSPNLLSSEHNPILRVFNTLSNISFSWSFRVAIFVRCHSFDKTVVWVICDKHP
jgi:hypothetical protein